MERHNFPRWTVFIFSWKESRRVEHVILGCRGSMAAGVLTEERPVGTSAQTTLPFTFHFLQKMLKIQIKPLKQSVYTQDVTHEWLDFALLAFSLNFQESVESLGSSEKQEGLSRQNWWVKS